MRLLLLVAGLAYGAMPMHGAVAAPTAIHAEMTRATDAFTHHHHEKIYSVADVTCPHGTSPPEQKDQSGHPIMGGVHCSSTCLTLAPIMSFIDADAATGSVEVPGLAPRLDSVPIAPLERPPRSRG